MNMNIVYYKYVYILSIMVCFYGDVTQILWKPRLKLLTPTEAAALHAEASGELCGSASRANQNGKRIRTIGMCHKAKDQKMKGLNQ